MKRKRDLYTPVVVVVGEVVWPGEVLTVVVEVLEVLELVEAASLQLNSLHVCISD